MLVGRYRLLVLLAGFTSSQALRAAQLDEILVTARKTLENVQNIPVELQLTYAR